MFFLNYIIILVNFQFDKYWTPITNTRLIGQIPKLPKFFQLSGKAVYVRNRSTWVRIPVGLFLFFKSRSDYIARVGCSIPKVHLSFYSSQFHLFVSLLTDDNVAFEYRRVQRNGRKQGDNSRCQVYMPCVSVPRSLYLTVCRQSGTYETYPFLSHFNIAINIDSNININMYQSIISKFRRQSL